MEAKLVIKNAVWTQLQGVTYAVIEHLMSELKVRDKYSPFGFKRQGHTLFPGYVMFMDPEGFFLTGLIPLVEEYLGKIGFECKVYRTKACPPSLEIDESLITPSIVKPRGNDLREDQVEFIRRFATYRRGIVWAATGFGKTAIMASILKLAPPKTPTLILINSVDLIAQTFNEFAELGVPREDLGMFTGDVKKANYITITTSDSLPGLVDILPNIRILLADEAHYKIVSKSVTPYLREMISATERVAFSATPFKKKDGPHNWKLHGHFGIVLGEAKTKPLQEAGILSRATTTFHVVGSGDISDSNDELPFDKAYVELVVENQEWHDQVARLVSGFKGRTLIRVERKIHGMYLVDRIPGAIWISGDDAKTFRAEVRQKLRDAPETVVVVATRIFNTGVDLYLHNLVNCAGMASDIATIQGYGRGLRLAPDKDHVDYHDFYHTTNKYLRRHASARAKTLKKEGHIVDLVDDL